ncbi:MAG: DUF3846 domain-containing protein [Clostridiales bacterium]|nr:DUF3846 domain-containing protein [Clostridiales bacterium]
MSKITAIIKQPFSRPYVTEIENSLESYQKIVGGRIECVDMPKAKGIDIILNEEGKLDGLAPNVFLPEYDDCIMGPIVVVAFNPQRGNHLGLSNEQVSDAMNYLNKNHVISIEHFKRSFCL